MSKFQVGDTVVVTSVNRREPREATVEKVGRTLVHVADQWGRTETFRIETGAKKDNYQHERVWTLFEWEARKAESEALRRITDHGLRFDYGRQRYFSTAALVRIADLLDDLAATEPA